jgi:dolichol kinase
MEKLIHAIRTAPTIPEQIQIEIIRKAIHLLVALVPLLAELNKPVTMVLLAVGTLFYLFSEEMRMEGRPVLVVSTLTLLASRARDRGRIVLGPITLGLGAMLALLLYPEPAASIAIYALAFGDSLAGLTGRIIGGMRLPLTGGKTFTGSMACLLVVLWATYRITGDLSASVAIALSATLFEALPTGDLDNLILPVGTGLVAGQVLQIL